MMLLGSRFRASLFFLCGVFPPGRTSLLKQTGAVAGAVAVAGAGAVVVAGAVAAVEGAAAVAAA
eukprot:7926241-Lingulodinium_polyedra.AAC.1